MSVDTNTATVTDAPKRIALIPSDGWSWTTWPIAYQEDAVEYIRADMVSALLAERDRLETAHAQMQATMDRLIARAEAWEEAALKEAIEVIREHAWPHVANNAQGWSMGRAASRDDQAVIDAFLAKHTKGDSHDQ